MKRKKLLTLLGSICLVLVLGALLIPGCAKEEAPAPPAPAPIPAKPTSTLPPKPDMFVWASHDIGAATYIQSAMVGEGILKAFEINLRVVPIAGEFSRITLVRTGEMDGFFIGGGMIDLWQGGSDYADRAWGPQPIRHVWRVKPDNPLGIATREDTGIKTAADLKGKRLAFYIAAPSVQLTMDAILAFANLTWDDVQPVEVGGFGDGAKALLARKVDACLVSGASALAAEQAASPGGLYWIPLPIENKEGWKRYRKVNPAYFPVQAHYGPGVPPDNVAWCTTVAIPALYTYNSADADKVYWQAKAIAESFPYYKDISKPIMEWWSLESLCEVEAHLPYHEGVIRYFKEKGVWTDDMEARQKMLLSKEQKVKAMWENAIKEAGEKGVKDKEFPAFWLERLETFREQE